MWWECHDCVAGGNGDKSHSEHKRDHPDHRVTIEFDVEKEDD